MLKSVLVIIALALLGYLALCMFLYTVQRSMLYYPTPEVSARGAEPIWLEQGGERLKIWFVPGTGERALIYFGGNAENVAGTITELTGLAPGYSLYLVNYRGYGGSTGTPTEQGLLADGLAVYDHVKQRRQSICLMGRSLGTGVAVHVAAHRPVDRLVLVTPYDSMAHVASSHYPLVPVGPLLKDRYDSLRWAGVLDADILVLIAERDEVIPAGSSSSLVAALPRDRTRTVVVRGAGHNTIGSSPEYRQSISEFLNASPAPGDGQTTGTDPGRGLSPPL